MDKDFEAMEKYSAYAKHDNITSPLHYMRGNIEVKDFIYDQKLNFNLGNVVKYVCRESQKNGLEDLKKAQQYIKFEIEAREKEKKGNDL